MSIQAILKRPLPDLARKKTTLRAAWTARRSRWILAALFLSALLAVDSAVASDAYGAGFYTRGGDTARYLDSGDEAYDPFYVPTGRLALVPRLSLSASHESNLYLESGDTRSGTIFHLVPGLMLIYGRPEASHLYLDYGLSLPVYRSVGDIEKDPSHLLRLGGVFRTEKSQLHTRLGFRSLEDLNTLVGARILKQDYIADAVLDHRISHKSTVGILGSYERHRFDADQYTGYTRLYGGARLYHDLSVKSQLFLQGGIGHDDVDSRPDGTGDADYHDVSAGIRGKPTPKTSATGRVGYQWRTFDDDRRDALEHWIASLGAEARPFGFTTFAVELLADIRPAINETSTSVIDQRITGSVNRRLVSDRLRGQASAFFGRVDYRGLIEEPLERETDFSLVYDRRQDDYWGYQLGLDAWLIQNFSVGVSYSYIDNRAAREADRETRRAAAYDSGVWTFRASWNY